MTSTLRRTLAALLVLPALGLAGCSSAADLKKGDCAAKDGSDSISPTECDADDAAYKVITIEEKVSETQAGIMPCSDVKEATDVFWMGEDGKPTAKTGTLYCLKALK